MPFQFPDPVVNHGSWDENRDGLQRNLEAAALALPGFGGESVEIRFGTGTVTWAGGNPYTNTVGVTHGLGRTPVAAVAVAALASGQAAAALSIVSLDATNVVWQGVVCDGLGVYPAAAANRTFYWVAIG